MIPQDDRFPHKRPSFARVEASPVFLPHCQDPRIVSMGLSAMEGPWVDRVSTSGWPDYKQQVRQEYGDRVYAVLPNGMDAACELADAVTTYLGRGCSVSDKDALWRASLEVADDLVVMQSDAQGIYRLMAASLCSPSDWRLEEKLGKTMAEVHGPIPRLNADMGPQIDRFFTRLPLDRFVQRFNWSLMPHSQYLSRDEWALTASSDALWYRAERQSLRRLPVTGAIAFTIRVHICPLAALKQCDGALESLWAAVDAAPHDLRHYKGLDILEPVIARWRCENHAK